MYRHIAIDMMLALFRLGGGDLKYSFFPRRSHGRFLPDDSGQSTTTKPPSSHPKWW